MPQGKSSAPSSSALRNRGQRSGFTLIEVLVAFLVLAFGTLAIQQAVMASVDSTGRAEDRLQAELVARSLMTTPIAQDPGEAVRKGVMDGLAWTIRYEPLRLPFSTAADAAGKPVAWTARRMIVTVQLRPLGGLPFGSRRDRSVSIETIRLVPLPAKGNPQPEGGSP